MNNNKIMKVFEQYMKKFNVTKNSTKAQYFHSLKVMELSEDIASVLGIFTEEEIAVCGLIGLFHDIASFSNNSYSLEDNSEDSARRSVDILFDDGLIRKITSDTKYDNIIKIAIYCYNKSSFPNKLDPKILHFCKVLKDAHIIDSFRLVLNYPYLDLHIDNYPTELVYNGFKDFKTVSSKLSDNNADNVLVVLSGVFSLNYRYSYSIVKENLYITKIIRSLILKDKGLAKFFRQIDSVLNKYIERKIGG